MIKVGLNKIVYDDPAVFRRLRVDNDFVARCAASFNAAISEDIDTLVKLVEKASKKALDVTWNRRIMRIRLATQRMYVSTIKLHFLFPLTENPSTHHSQISAPP